MIRLYINDKEIELDNNLKIALTMQFNNVYDPAVVKNSFSKTVQIPATPGNSRIFDHFWHIDHANLRFNPLTKHNEFVLTWNDHVIESGYVKLDDISYSSQYPKTYNLTLYGGLGDFFYKLSEKKLEDSWYKTDGNGNLPVDKEGNIAREELEDEGKNFYNHTINRYSVIASWYSASQMVFLDEKNYKGNDYYRYLLTYNGKYNNFDSTKEINQLEDYEIITTCKTKDGFYGRIVMHNLKQSVIHIYVTDKFNNIYATFKYQYPLPRGEVATSEIKLSYTNNLWFVLIPYCTGQNSLWYIKTLIVNEDGIREYPDFTESYSNPIVKISNVEYSYFNNKDYYSLYFDSESSHYRYNINYSENRWGKQGDVQYTVLNHTYQPHINNDNINFGGYMLCVDESTTGSSRCRYINSANAGNSIGEVNDAEEYTNTGNLAVESLRLSNNTPSVIANKTFYIYFYFQKKGLFHKTNVVENNESDISQNRWQKTPCSYKEEMEILDYCFTPVVDGKTVLYLLIKEINSNKRRILNFPINDDAHYFWQLGGTYYIEGDSNSIVSNKNYIYYLDGRLCLKNSEKDKETSYIEIETQTTYTLPDAGFEIIGLDSEGVDEHQRNEFRSYYQTPALYINKIFDRICETSGFQVKKDILPDGTSSRYPFFVQTNPYWYKTLLTMNRLQKKNTDIAEEETQFRSNDKTVVTFNQMCTSGMTQADFIINYCKLFGLIFEKDKTQKTIYINTRNAYFTNFNVLDFTEKIDYSQDFKLSPLSFNYKYFLFEWKENGSYLEESYTNKYNIGFGAKQLNTGYEFNDNNQDFNSKNPFIDVIMSSVVGDYNLFLNRRISRDDKVLPSFYTFSDGSRNSNESRFGIVFWEKAIFTPYRLNVTDDSAGSIFENTYCWNGEEVESIPYDFYPKVSRLTDNCSLDFSKPSEYYDISVNDANYKDTQTIYSRFWKSFLEDRLSANTRIISCSAYLTPLDIANFRFNTFISLRNTLWHINKIIDYDITTQKSTKIELIRVEDIDNYVNGQSLP